MQQSMKASGTFFSLSLLLLSYGVLITVSGFLVTLSFLCAQART
jgi:hypothetical protein